MINLIWLLSVTCNWFPGLVSVAFGCLTLHSQTVAGDLQIRDGKILDVDPVSV